MIWTTHQLSPDALKSANYVYSSYTHPEMPQRQRRPSAVAVVGGGPKGYYAVQRLVHALLRAGQLADTTIHWFNTDRWFGCGGNFRPDQPEFLLVNNSIGTIDAEAIVGQSNPLVQWINRYRLTHIPAASYTDFSSRALVGHYLSDTVVQFLNHLPIGTDLQLVVGQVTDIFRSAGNLRVRLADQPPESALPVLYDSVMLATGHFYFHRHPEWALFAEEIPQVTYIPQVYPLQRLANVPAGSSVAMQGLGLTFIDAVLALTEGRGGIFHGKGDSLRYRPSGKEPSAIFPFSRSNLPMLARSPLAVTRRYPLRFITPYWADDLQARYGANIDFEREIIPALAREMAHAYHRTLWDDYDSDDAAVDQRIADTDPSERFSIEQFLFGTFPLPERISESSRQRIQRYLKLGLSEAGTGEYASPLMAAAGIWREAVPIIRPLYANGGFSGAAQRQFIQRYYGALNRTAFGPPAENMRKIACLIDAGYIRFPFAAAPAVHTDYRKRMFLLSDGNEHVEVPILIDARIGRPNLDVGNSELFANLLAGGLAKPMQNDGFRPGCVALAPDGLLLAANGRPTPIGVYGTPTEGVTLDNDSLSPSCNDLATPWAASVVSSLARKNEAQYIHV